MKTLRIILSAIAGILVTAGVAYATFYTYTYYSTVQADNGVFEYGCIPRPSANVNGGDWFILNNDTHEPESCTSITTYSDKIQVHLDNCFDQVITGYVTVDEAFAREGITPGLMMGLCEWTIWFYDREGNLINPSTLSSGSGVTPGISSNLWVWVRGAD